MSNMPLHQQQLEFMSALARHRVDFLNPFFDFLGYFDSPYFFYVLVPAIWLGFSYQWGLRIFYWFSLNTIVNSYLKVWIGWPRPSQDLPEIALFHPSSGGFPSGGAQLCMFLGGLLIYYGRTRAARIVGVTYILLISYSRLYLGVHYPIDILGGWVIAWLLLFLFIVVQKPLEKFLITRGLSFCLLLSLIVPLAIIALAQNPILTYIMG
ncbi:MAG TPA: phosphatase PAP2 family protein, partial [Chlamydiales bacterium]|nr:phosphatase PAP2 family protein [Chlamydiales bacterium]